MSGRHHFDTETSLDFENGYPERDVAWFKKNVLTDFAGVVTEHGLSGSLLDVGCASGYFTRYYASLFDEVLGIDLSPVRIVKANEINGALGVSYEIVDITARCVGANNDVAVSSGVFQHIAPSLRAQAFKNVKGSLKPGGTLILYDAIHELQPNPPTWDGYTELLTLEFLQSSPFFRVDIPLRFIAVDGGRFDIYRTVLSAR